MTKRFELDFQGYWGEAGVPAMPVDPGLLCTYARVKAQAPEHFPDKVRILRIESCPSGKAAASAVLLSTELRGLILEDEELLFSFAPLLFGREQAAAALIYQHKPLGNHEHKFCLRFEPTHVAITGQAAKLRPGFLAPDPEDRDISHLLERLGSSLSA